MKGEVAMASGKTINEHDNMIVLVIAVICLLLGMLGANLPA